MNSSKNKLNSKISWQISSMPNAHLGFVCDPFILLKLKFFAESNIDKGKY